jgi:hypothetical protein
MSIARRNFLVFAAATALAREAAWGDDGRARFWRVEMPDGGQGIVFGYARIAAAITLDIVCDGTRLVGEARRVVLDMDNVKLPAMKIDATLPPILSRLDSARADEVRKILAAMHVPQASSTAYRGSWSRHFSTVKARPTRCRQSVVSPWTVSRRSAGRSLPCWAKRMSIGCADLLISPLLIGPSRRRLLRFYSIRGGKSVPSARIPMGSIAPARARNWIASPNYWPTTAFPNRARTSTPMRVSRVLLDRLSAALQSHQTDDLAFCFVPIGLLTGPSSIFAALRNRGARTTVVVLTLIIKVWRRPSGLKTGDASLLFSRGVCGFWSVM